MLELGDPAAGLLQLLGGLQGAGLDLADPLARLADPALGLVRLGPGPVDDLLGRGPVGLALPGLLVRPLLQVRYDGQLGPSRRAGRRGVAR